MGFHPAMKSLLGAAMIFCASISLAADNTELTRQVTEAERGFAQTMVERDFEKFASFIADDAVFYGNSAQRGKHAVLAEWQAFFKAEQAPFSWRPEQVDVLDSGTLAHSSGPVIDAKGNVVAHFNSVWRLQAPGVWKVVFDKDCRVCACEKPQDATDKK